MSSVLPGYKGDYLERDSALDEQRRRSALAHLRASRDCWHREIYGCANHCTACCRAWLSQRQFFLFEDRGPSKKREAVFQYYRTSAIAVRPRICEQYWRSTGMYARRSDQENLRSA